MNKKKYSFRLSKQAELKTKRVRKQTWKYNQERAFKEQQREENNNWCHVDVDRIPKSDCLECDSMYGLYNCECEQRHFRRWLKDNQQFFNAIGVQIDDRYYFCYEQFEHYMEEIIPPDKFMEMNVLWGDYVWATWRNVSSYERKPK
jgi:hypothetical protein